MHHELAIRGCGVSAWRGRESRVPVSTEVEVDVGMDLLPTDLTSVGAAAASASDIDLEDPHR